MSADGATCDHCGAGPTPYFVDSAKALTAWNREHPDDVRERLYFCSKACTFARGYLIAIRADVVGTA